MLPAPRPRLDAETVRARLRALAAGDLDGAGAGRADRAGGAAPGAAPDDAPDPALVERAIAAERRRRAGSLLLAVLLAAGAGWFVLQVLRGPDPAPLQLVPGAPPASVAPGPGAGSPGTVPVVAPGTPAPASPEPSPIVVHVLGEVRRPGLVRLEAGSRVADALRAAGGLVPGGSSGGLNLARPLVDGEQVVVSAEAGPDPPGGAAGPGAAAGGVIDLNDATEADLDTLPGVGPVLAGRILDWREAHGRFASVDQLAEVPGIGERTLDRLAPLVRV